MRYQDWDVILFPGESSTPFQEFRTSCLCTQDPEYAQFQLADPEKGPGSSDEIRFIQLPIVAACIPSLTWGLPFRVSVHSWGAPRLSRPVPQTAQRDAVGVFEVRVVVDGCCIATAFYKPTATWPQTIGTTTDMDLDGNRDSLRFPPFYPELTRNRGWWNAVDNMGRIKVIIAEGFGTMQSVPVFERVKNIVCFNFQHAPLVVWEKFGVAWPNPGMWYRPRQLSYAAPTLALRRRSRTGPEAHAHLLRDRISSRRSTISSGTTAGPGASDVERSVPPPAVPYRGLARTPDWTTPMNLPDPFVDDDIGQRHRSLAGRSRSEDLAMPDYSRSITPAGPYDFRELEDTNDKAVVLMAPISQTESDTVSNATGIRKDGTSGTFAPRDDRKCSNATSDASTVVTKPSAAAEARVAGRGQRHGRQTFFRRRAKSTNRKKSDVSTKSRRSESAGESQDMLDDKVPTKPVDNIKGKKEGGGSDLEAKQRETSTGPSLQVKKENARIVNKTRATVSEGKRKRVLTVPENARRAKAREVQSSPTRQTTSRVTRGGRRAVVLDLTVDDGSVKAPLQVLKNVQ